MRQQSNIEHIASAVNELQDIDGKSSLLAQVRGDGITHKEFGELCKSLLPDHFTIWVSAFNNRLVEEINSLINRGDKITVAISNDVSTEILPKIKWHNHKPSISRFSFGSSNSDIDNELTARKLAEQIDDKSRIFIVSHTHSENIEGLLVDGGIDNQRITNFVFSYSIQLVNYFLEKAETNRREIENSITSIISSYDESQVKHRIRGYVFNWMTEAYTDLFMSQERADTDYHISIAKLTAASKDKAPADKAVEELIELNTDVNTASLKRVWVIVDHQCNLRCDHCWIWNEAGYEAYNIKEHLAKTNLNPDELKTLFSRSVLLKKAVTVMLTGGELFLRKDAKEIMQGLAQEDIFFEIQTNATYPKRLENALIDDDIRQHIKTVCISLDGDPKTHDQIRGKRSFERLAQTVEVLKAFNMPYRFISVIQENNKELLEATYDTGKALEPNGHDFNCEFEGGKYLSDLFLDEASKYMHSAQFYKMLGEDNYDGRGCLAGSTRCVILPGGDVEACSQSRVHDDHYVLGNVYDFDMDFDALWTSSNAKQVRNRIRTCSPGCAIPCERGEVSG